jgi:hypothetical protein
MSKVLLLAIGLAVLTCETAYSQIIEIRRPLAFEAMDDAPVEFLSRGLLDLHVNGQVEASAQMVRIRIGEPNGFNVPFYLLVGATRSAFGDDQANEATVTDLINPTGGLVNGSFQADLPVWRSASEITFVRLAGSGGGRLVSGRSTLEDELKVFGAGYADGGILFQTGAWEADGSYLKGGMAWVQARYAASFIPSEKREEMFGLLSTNPSGIRIEGGILIQDRVNVKLGAYLPQTGRDLPTLGAPAWRLALDYNVK